MAAEVYNVKMILLTFFKKSLQKKKMDSVCKYEELCLCVPPLNVFMN